LPPNHYINIELEHVTSCYLIEGPHLRKYRYPLRGVRHRRLLAKPKLKRRRNDHGIVRREDQFVNLSFGDSGTKRLKRPVIVPGVMGSQEWPLERIEKYNRARKSARVWHDLKDVGQLSTKVAGIHSAYLDKQGDIRIAPQRCSVISRE
jgi:hypothetical protein